MPNIARAFDILAGQAGRVLERDILMKKQRQEMIDKLLTEQAHRSYLKRLELDREEAFKTKLQKITGEQADKRSQFAAEQAWQRTEAEIKGREKVAEMRLQAAKAGKTGRVNGSTRVYENPYLSGMLDESRSRVEALLKIVGNINPLTGQPTFPMLDDETRRKVTTELDAARYRRDQLLKEYQKQYGKEFDFNKPESTPTGVPTKKKVPW